MICGCTHPLVDETRATIIREITTTMNKHPPDSPIYKCMEAVRHLAQPECIIGAPHYVWIGTWSPPQIAFLHQALHEVTFNPHCNFDSTIIALKATCMTLASGAHNLMAARHKVHTQLQRARRRLHRFERVAHRATVVHPSHPHTRSPVSSNSLQHTVSHLLSVPLHRHGVYTTAKQSSTQSLDSFLRQGVYNAHQSLNIPHSIRPVHQPLGRRPQTRVLANVNPQRHLLRPPCPTPSPPRSTFRFISTPPTPSPP